MNGLVALVTGAASGLGKATAQFLLNNGCRVAALDQHKFDVPELEIEDVEKPEEHQKFLDEIRTKYNDFDRAFDSSFDNLAQMSAATNSPVANKLKANQTLEKCCETAERTFFNNETVNNCIFAVGDICCPKEVSTILENVRLKWGKLDIAVNCAGISRVVKCYNHLSDRPMELETFRKVMDINLVGTFNVIRLVAREMSRNEPKGNGERGVIINTSSFVAFEGPESTSCDAAAARAVASMTLPLSRDLASLGIRVNTVAPGYIDTPALGDIPDDVATVVSLLNAFPNRLGKSDEFAHLIGAIVSNPMLNGATIRYDAGMRSPPL